MMGRTQCRGISYGFRFAALQFLSGKTPAYFCLMEKQIQVFVDELRFLGFRRRFRRTAVKSKKF
jgi:hypothetical protein